MYCKYCDAELPANACFCSVCGNPIGEAIQQKQEKVLPQKISDYVGNNKDYFSKEFANAEHGLPTKFNWAAFWLGPFYCVYRKQYDILRKYFKVPLGAFFISFLGVTIQIMDGNMDIDALLKWTMFWLGLSFVATLWLYVAQVQLGRNFNRLYFENLKKKIAEKKSLKEYGGTSVKNIVLLCLLSSFLLSLPVVAIVKTQVFPALYSSNSYDMVEEKVDENEVIYGYNTYNPGIEIDEAIQNVIIGDYDLGDGITISISMDDNLRMTMYADGQQQSWFQLSVWNVEGNTVIFQGYLGDEIWEAMDIYSMEDAEVQIEVVISGGKVTNIFENGTDIWFQKL